MKRPLCSLRSPVQISSSFLREPSPIRGQIPDSVAAGCAAFLCGKSILGINRGKSGMAAVIDRRYRRFAKGLIRSAGRLLCPSWEPLCL